MELFKFEPLLKQTIWGGSKIVTFKHLQSDLDNVGESWEISGVPGDESVVANGEWKGKTLNEVLAEMKDKLVGADNYQRFGNRFPLLIKFIDARQDLSIQVHPDDETAHKQGKPMGKTEMWYVMDSDEGASLKVGLKKKITPEDYARMVDDDTICDALGNYQVKSGDCFFIQQDEYIPSAADHLLPKYSRPAMSLIVSTTISARTRTAITVNCIPRRPPKLSTIQCSTTTARIIHT